MLGAQDLFWGQEHSTKKPRDASLFQQPPRLGEQIDGARSCGERGINKASVKTLQHAPRHPKTYARAPWTNNSSTLQELRSLPTGSLAPELDAREGPSHPLGVQLRVTSFCRHHKCPQNVTWPHENVRKKIT